MKQKMLPARQCQPCTACCDGWLQMTIDGVDVYPGKPCPHSTGHGCKSYEIRPENPCRQFECAWIIKGSPLPEWMKPCEAKVLVLFGAMTWRNGPVELAVPVGKRIPPRTLNWLKQFAETHQRPLVYLEQPPGLSELVRDPLVLGHGPQPFIRELSIRVERSEPLWLTRLETSTNSPDSKRTAG